MKKTFIILCALLIVPVFVTAQTKTNLEKIFQLIDNSVVKVGEVVGKTENVALSVTGTVSLELLKPKVQAAFSNRGYKMKNENSDEIAKVTYSLNQAKVEYANAEKDGFFGDVIAERIVSLNGIVSIISSDGLLKTFDVNESAKDTIIVDEIKNYEDSTVPFTQGKKPEVSFFSNLLEPVLVVGTLVTTIILLFTVRGK
ncbi:MAG: hypothetical protein A2279_13090 [Stygiobacter sp. RIFOXYA12_FULL_38_9]|nr:MAG: hypothetical protein A2279_13090 [Stygiobacter sp. RIFOXYA12_FULL_38_9]OGV05899.1 MAG: hypothetical protein A2299_10715 [Stygiobacter sp. RIFOXYB2_FULL_37_11]OGV10688.1 MAG: hypothetical protein A2237_10270 [Stygiobacter sp. RIFOXYA2_FULL_38_8]OGV14490.1 MAG: hypothetical protein A2440_08610 [Stygiobacter sp. RIFOXYC2_FULL_38_25]OGV82250.1 MAG: hypothetical protein A2X65_17965 [Stygiobacter sp. GWF2_38_21]OGV93762.1 MAG: hypothetical protein A3J88_08195 [Melioribacter sp. RIFOXYB12_FUL